MSISGIESPTNTEILGAFKDVLMDLYGSYPRVYSPEEGDAIFTLWRMAERYAIPFEIVVAKPIRVWQDAGEWLEAPPAPSQILIVASRIHRDLLIARDQHNTHGKNNIVENLIPVRAIRHQLENDLQVMETVAIHVGPDSATVSKHGAHFVSEWWRAGESLLWDGEDGCPLYLEFLDVNSGVRKAVTETVEGFYDRLN